MLARLRKVRPFAPGSRSIIVRLPMGESARPPKSQCAQIFESARLSRAPPTWKTFWFAAVRRASPTHSFSRSQNASASRRSTAKQNCASWNDTWRNW